MIARRTARLTRAFFIARLFTARFTRARFTARFLTARLTTALFTARFLIARLTTALFTARLATALLARFATFASLCFSRKLAGTPRAAATTCRVVGTIRNRDEPRVAWHPCRAIWDLGPIEPGHVAAQPDRT